jgi:hypothetical protein
MKMSGLFDRPGEAAVLVSPSTFFDGPRVVRIYLSTEIAENIDPLPEMVFTSRNGTHSVSYAAPATGDTFRPFDACMLPGQSILLVTAFWSTNASLSTSMEISNITLTNVNCTPPLNSKTMHIIFG